MKAATERGRGVGSVSQISIHAAREGGDRNCGQYAYQHIISIHAAREGGDVFIAAVHRDAEHFNPRRP